MLYRAMTTSAGRFSFQAGEENLNFEPADVKELVEAGCLKPMVENVPVQMAAEAPAVEAESTPAQPTKKNNKAQ